MEGQMKKTRQHYPRQMMIQVAMEVITGIKGPIEAARDYNVSQSNVFHWVKRYKSEVIQRQTQEALTLPTMRDTKPNKKETDAEKRLQMLEEENRQLRQKLLDSNLKAEALTTMIELAEEHYGIPLRKNSGAKQSSE